MAPRPKKRTSEVSTAPNTLLSALQFVGNISSDIGAPFETHMQLGANWATAFNGTIAAGHPITEDIYACPHAKLIVEALSKCGEHISFTQLDANRLSIKSDKFKAIVPCINPTLINHVIPDPPIAPIDDRFKAGISIVGTLANENGQFIYLASILMNGYSLISTNGKVVLEYWHGINLPPGISLPKVLVDPLTKTNKKLVQFGYSQSSVTFYFEDGSWLRSQLYREQWPDMSLILDRPANAWPVVADFWRGLDAVAGFSESGFVYFGPGVLHSHENPTSGASYEVVGLPKGPAFPAKQLAMIQPYADRIDFLAKDCLLFFGSNVRGIIAGVRQ